jgi:REP element-mobilizing transposase RayT
VPRIPRGQQGGYAYHVINRGNGRTTVFHKPQDYEAFLSLLSEAKTRHGVKIFGFCLMPNHFHGTGAPNRIEPIHAVAIDESRAPLSSALRQ